MGDEDWLFISGPAVVKPSMTTGPSTGALIFFQGGGMLFPQSQMTEDRAMSFGSWIRLIIFIS